MGIPFRERNPVPIGAVGLVVIAAAAVPRLQRCQSLPLIGGGDTYRAAFTEAGGLKAGDDVRIAGVKVGKVTASTSRAATSLVDFTVTEAARLRHRRPRPSMRIKTLLGEKYLALDAGRRRASSTADSEIPLSPHHCRSYDVVDAFSDLTTTTEQIDTGQLATSLGRPSPTEFKDSPADVKAVARRPVPAVPHHRLARRRAAPAARAGQQRHAARRQPQRAGAQRSSRTATCSWSSSTRGATTIHTLFLNTSRARRSS